MITDGKIEESFENANLIKPLDCKTKIEDTGGEKENKLLWKIGANPEIVGIVAVIFL